MDVTASEAFRLGFLTRCAEEGLTGDALTARIKSASEKRSWVGPLALTLGALGLGDSIYRRGVVGGAGDVYRGALGLLGTSAAVGLGGGAAAGYGLARATEPNVTDDDIRSQELAQTYKILANKARAKRKAKEYRAPRY
jgi:hypothetical protein